MSDYGKRNYGKRLLEAANMYEKQIDSGIMDYGEYTTLNSEEEIEELAKRYENIVIHFYLESDKNCKIIDKHMEELTAMYYETKFCRVDATKAYDLITQLEIRYGALCIPTIALWKESKIVDAIIGFEDLGGVEDFSTEMLEWRIAKAGVISYEGDLHSPPDSPSIISGKLAECKYFSDDYKTKRINVLFWEKYTTSDEKSSTSDEKSSTSDEKSSTSDEKSSTSGEKSSTIDDKPSTSGEGSSIKQVPKNIREDSDE